MELLLYAELNIFCMVLLGIIAEKVMHSKYSNTAKDKAFSAGLWFVMAFAAFDALEHLVAASGFSGKIPVLYGLNLAYFICFDLAAFCWFLYAGVLQNKKALQNKKRWLATAVPLEIVAVLLATSCQNDWIFKITPNGSYARGPLFWVQMLVSYGYVAVTLAQSLYRAVHQTYFARRNELLTVAVCSLAILLCGLLQLLVPAVPLLVCGITVSVLVKFINTLKLMILLDPLTGIPNRRELLASLTFEMKTVKAGEQLYFLFIDVDSFKQINDSCGHTEGDRILSKVSAAIQDFCEETHGYCARYGGDEFAVLQVLKQGGSIQAVCSNLKKYIYQRNIKTCQNSRVQISIGYAAYRGKGDSPESLIARADDDMYQSKLQNRSGQQL